MYHRLKEFVLQYRLEFALGCVGIYCVIGSVVNMYASSSESATQVPQILEILMLFLFLFLYGAILFSILSLGRTIEDWGFTLDSRSAYSIVPGFVVLLLVAVQGTTLTAESCINVIFGIIKFSAEELYCRVLLVTILLKLFRQSKHKGWWAVIGSSVVFAIPHLFLKEWSFSFALANGLGGGLLLGFVFYQTRSIFFPIVAHVSFNTAREGGALGGLLFAIFYFALVLGKRALVKHKSKTVLSSIRVPERK